MIGLAANSPLPGPSPTWQVGIYEDQPKVGPSNQRAQLCYCRGTAREARAGPKQTDKNKEHTLRPEQMKALVFELKRSLKSIVTGSGKRLRTAENFEERSPKWDIRREFKVKSELSQSVRFSFLIRW